MCDACPQEAFPRTDKCVDQRHRSRARRRGRGHRVPSFEGLRMAKQWRLANRVQEALGSLTNSAFAATSVPPPMTNLVGGRTFYIGTNTLLVTK